MSWKMIRLWERTRGPVLFIVTAATFAAMYLIGTAALEKPLICEEVWLGTEDGNYLREVCY